MGWLSKGHTNESLRTPSDVALRPAQTYPVVQGKTFKFEKIADGFYYATGGAGSNQVVVVNDRNVMLVDDGTPPAARALLEDIKTITANPVR